MNKRELDKLASRSQYDPAWRKWRQGYAPKSRMRFWQRLQLMFLRKVLEKFAGQRPGDAAILSSLGVISKLEGMDEARKGNTESAALLRQDAIQKSREAVALAPNDAHEHFMLGVALDSDKQHEEAMAEYEETLRLDPASSHGHSLLALSLQRQGKLNEAIEEARQSIALAPTAEHLRLGSLLNQAGRIEEARGEWEKVLSLDKGILASAARLHLQGRQ